jgi:pilus assembly protein CpaB
MRTNSILILAVAVVMGGIAAFLARNWLLSQTQGPVAAPSETTIVVAAAPLNFGTALTAENTLEIKWASKTIPEGSFATKQQLLKDGRRVVLTSLDRNEPVLKTKVTAPGQRGALSTLLEPGKRAVTVRVDDVRGVGGFLQPGDRVDVVLIRTEGPRSEGYSDLILQNMKVLAVDQIAGERSEAPTVPKAVTLEVTPEEAQKVLLATNIGRLSLILRQPGEARTASSRRVTDKDLALIERTIPESVPHTAEAPPVQRGVATVVIIRDMKREEYSVVRQ